MSSNTTSSSSAPSAPSTSTSSRLDRLISLLDTGSTPAIRTSAASQLGHIAHRNAAALNAEDAAAAAAAQGSAGGDADAVSTSNPWAEGVLLLAKVVPLLRSRTWDTRLAAATAIGSICDALPLWTPTSTHHGGHEDPPGPSPLASFDLPRLLASGTKLLSSAGKEYDGLARAGAGVTAAERLAHAKRSMQSLGLSVGGIGDLDLGMDVEAELQAADKATPPPPPPPQPAPPPAVPDFSSTSSLSARERNALKRKMKAAGGAGEDGAISSSRPDKRRMLSSDAVSSNTDVASPTSAQPPVTLPPSTNDAFALLNEDPLGWPFEPLCALLAADLFNPSWEIRHGAALGLRELMRSQGPGAGLFIQPSQEPDGKVKREDGADTHAALGNGAHARRPNHAAFLEDVAVRLLSVCALDRLNDFVLDQVMAPVRETCAQALASLLHRPGPPSSVKAEADVGPASLDGALAPSTTTSSMGIPQRRTRGGAGMPLASVHAVHRALVQMIRQDEHDSASQRGSARTSTGTTFTRKRDDRGYAWEVRHAGFLGLKYEVSARLDLLVDTDDASGSAGAVKKENGSTASESEIAPGTPNAYFHEVVDLAVLGLRDEDDDIRSVAATTLTALAPVLGSLSSSSEHLDATKRVLDAVWSSLVEAGGDDLGSSMASIMDLLAKLMEHETVQRLIVASTGTRNGGSSHSTGTTLADRIRTLHPYFRHTISSVRLSVLRAISVFLRMSPSSSDVQGAKNEETTKPPPTWIDAPLLRLLFQNLIVEERATVREASVQAWASAIAALRSGSGSGSGCGDLVDLLAPYIPHLFQLIMTPLGSAIDTRLLYRPPNKDGHHNGSGSNGNGHGHDVDKGMLSQDLSLVGVDTIMHGRLGAARALGDIMRAWPVERQDVLADQLLHYLDSTSALQKCLASAIIQEWAESQPKTQLSSDTLASQLSKRLIAILEAPTPPSYAEMEVALSRLRRECQSLYWAFHSEARVAREKVPTLPSRIDAIGQGQRADAFTLDTARYVVSDGYDALLKQVGSKSKKTHGPALEDRRRHVIASLGFYQSRKERNDVQVCASVAAALVALRMMPSKLNPVVRSLMNSVKFEENIDLQAASARSVARFVKLCGEDAADGSRSSNPSDKVVKNLCAFMCQDTTRTAVFGDVAHIHEGILSLDAELAAASNGATGKTAAGRPPPATSAPADANESEEVRQGKLIRRGAERALSELAFLFGPELFERVAALRSAIYDALAPASSSSSVLAGLDAAIAGDAGVGQGIIDACTVIEAIVPYIHPDLHAAMLDFLSPLGAGLKSAYAAIRSASARCYAAVVDVITEAGMLELVRKVVPMLGDATNRSHRQGAMELVLDVVRRLDTKLLPYVTFFIVPVLGRMTDADDQTRLAATNAFASLVKMVPLEAGLPDPAGFPAEMLARREDERKFLDQLLNGKVEEYQLPVKMNASLRKYQREGVSWMAFLAKFKLHGILCDDMGLGKTLQSITILSCDHHERAQAYQLNRSPEYKSIPSLVVCPSTLTGHWYHEIKQYSNNLKPLLYVGQPGERARCQNQFRSHDVVITSYDILRNDVGILSAQSWNYCILDEGHIIKSAKTKTTKAAKALRANHRLILSGTPIQNSVLELWSLFDFLMPGFLGTERQFQQRYGKPILASREGKVTAREQEAATLALEALHKQVLPFLLRRMKEDVLDDLPPKIIQDIECDLGEIQQALYDDFTSSQDRAELEEAFDEQSAAGGEGRDGEATAPPMKQHAFQSLQYLRKLVNHPLLVLDKTNPRHAALCKRAESKGGLRDIAHAPKLQVLKQLLQDCGIGLGPVGAKTTGSSTESDLLSDVSGGAAVSQHRVLIFAQLKQMLDIIETDLFQAHMPSVTYMRLDGSVSADKRHGIVRTFNADPSIDVLLLTTSVGGLGLTLTGADTVIFVEHDWNPMKDLQAMDRAHRLGQKKVVNVYRLITRNTLEQKIMGLQRFKLNVANSVITQDNAALTSMDTDGILDLFGPSSSSSTSGAAAGDAAATDKTGGKKLSQKQLLEQLQNLPDTEEDEYRQMTSWRPT